MLFQVAARVAQTHAADGDSADLELHSDQIIQLDTLSHQVAPGLLSTDLDAAVLGQVFERLALDQGELPPVPRFIRIISRRLK